MKPFKVLTSAALATTIFSVGTLSALAADGENGGAYNSTGTVTFKASTDTTDPVNPIDPGETIDPENPGEPGGGTAGPLSIDFASSFDFGTQEISSNEKTYYAAAQKAKTADDENIEVPNYVQVTDNRGTETGWGLTVTQNTDFTSTTNEDHTLAGSKIAISNVEIATASESNGVTTEGEITLEAGAPEVVMEAASGTGAGTHLAVFGNDETKGDSVALTVPGSITKYAEKYETTLTWTLTDTVPNGGEDEGEGEDA